MTAVLPAGPRSRSRGPRRPWRAGAALAVPVLLAAAALPAPAVAADEPPPVAQPALQTEHVSATLSTMAARPGDPVDVILTMTVPPEGVPETADPRTTAVLSLRANTGLWDVVDGCMVLSGPAPTRCGTSYATHTANWFSGGIRQPGLIRLLFRSTVAPDAQPGTYNLTLRGTPGALPQERADAADAFTVLDPTIDE